MAGASNPDALDAHFKLYFMFSKVQQRTRSQFKPSKRRRRGWVEGGLLAQYQFFVFLAKPWVKAKPQKSRMKASLLTCNQDTAP